MPEPIDHTTYLRALAKWRSDRDDYFANHYATPLSDEAIARFAGIRYFEPDPGLVFETVLEPGESRILIESSTGHRSEYPAAGSVRVPFADVAFQLQVLRGEDDDLFIPFRDATAGVTTYSGGRYVGVESRSGDTVSIDFNKSINPYCAYDQEFSCPLPPPENWFPFAVAAGEMDYR
ncbi:MAG: DUF1684 domain-containing protein [bacterium]|nr:DUF1684 domain-containing protein [bacterium]